MREWLLPLEAPTWSFRIEINLLFGCLGWIYSYETEFNLLDTAVEQLLISFLEYRIGGFAIIITLIYYPAPPTGPQNCVIRERTEQLSENKIMSMRKP